MQGNNPSVHDPSLPAPVPPAQPFSSLLTDRKDNSVFHYSSTLLSTYCVPSTGKKYHFSLSVYITDLYDCLKKNVKLAWVPNPSFSSVQFSSVTQLCLTLCDPMNRSMKGLPVHHQLPEFTQTHVQRVGDAIQSSHPLSSPSPLAPNPSQHQSLFQ